MRHYPQRLDPIHPYSSLHYVKDHTRESTSGHTLLVAQAEDCISLALPKKILPAARRNDKVAEDGPRPAQTLY